MFTEPTSDYNSSVRSLLFWLIVALIVGLFYLAVSQWGFGYVGFPLDDAWIHQTYARNLADSGQLAFVPGVPSAGSTAPLWSLLLSLGYVLRIPFYMWAYGLGVILLGLSGWTVYRLGRRLFPENRWIGLGAGLFCVLEWHHVWAALSGMETMLFIWLSLLLVERYSAIHPTKKEAVPPLLRSSAPRNYFYLGLLGSLLTLTRPEGLGLVGLLGLHLGYSLWSRRQDLDASWFSALLRVGGWLSFGTILFIIPYIAFHLWATGLPFPNTFYAKQAEYGLILEAFPLWRRLVGNFGPVEESVQGVFRVIFIGPQLLLLPGLIFALWLTFKERRLALGPIWVWWISYLILYAVRLPVTYQHGRYQMPVIVWVILLGLWGTGRLLQPSSKPVNRSMIRRVASRVTGLSLLLLILGFTLLGAQAYGRDVRIIESEMVATAKWLDQNVGPEALIAAHDIGAIGYFTRRPLLDLAGLVSPEVIPIIRDEAALFDLIKVRKAQYIVTFPSWYPTLTQYVELAPRYATNAPWAPAAGGDNMVVYEITK